MTRTRDRLVAAAGDQFYSSGFQAVGLDSIIRAVGITKTAFYKHFESKDDLILAIMDQRDRKDIADMIAYMRKNGGTNPRSQVLALFDQLAEWFGQPEFRGCFFMNAATEFPSPTDPIHRMAATHASNIASEVLLRVQATGIPNPERITSQIMLLFSGAIAARHAGGMADAARAAKQAVESLLTPSNGRTKGRPARSASSPVKRRGKQPRTHGRSAI